MTRTLHLLLTLALAAAAFAQSNETCTDCHSDPSLTLDRLTGTVSLTVTEDSLKGSPHEGLNCVDCHSSLKGVDDYPHGAVKGVNCGECHQQALRQYMSGFFNKLQEMGYRGIPACTDCHGVHRMSRRADTRRVCGICHQAELKLLNSSIHAGGGPGTRPLVCTSCHEPHFKTRRGTMSAADWQMTLVRGCMGCHRRESQDYLDSRHYRTLLAGDTLAPTCITCHGDHAILSHNNPAAPTSTERLDNLCATCHRNYDRTLHRKDGVDARLMTCVACHTGHETQMVRTSGGVFRETLPETCNRCHGDERHAKETLAHGRIMSLESATHDEANCTQCHVYHWRRSALPPHQASLRMQCQNCHVKETQEYSRSRHALSRERGHGEAPTCVTCHGEVDIPRVAEGMKPQQVIDMCSRCHANRSIALKFQLNPEVVKSYKKTYHGQVYSLGYQGERFATCINCHGNHDIRDPDDPASRVSRQNIVQTCARCHADANENFVNFLSHYDPHGGPLGATHPQRRVSQAEKFMNGLLYFVFGFFGVHTILWFFRAWVERRRHPRTRSPVATRKWVIRFTPWQRTLHVILATSFLIQAMTGLPLKFSHSELAYWVASNVMNLHTMALLHRVGAALMFGVFILHLLTLMYATFVRREKGLWSGARSLIPSVQDARDMFNHFRWFLFLGPKPRFGRWTYWEKFDYFAVFWGVAVIGFSGLVLWFPEFATRWLSGWMINLAHIVHSEEALLATAFIFTVHFFNGHLRPDKFPLDDVIFTGRESTEEIGHERARQLEMLEAEGNLERKIVPPMKEWHRRALLVFGWTAFFMGFTLLIFILVSALIW